MSEYCKDCPDREACHQGMSCEASKRFAAAALVYQEKMKGKKNTMANSPKNNVTAADVVSEAAKDKLIAETVPAQGEKKETVTEEVTVTTAETESPELTVLEGGKKSLKDRVTAIAKKVEKNKKLVIAVGVAVGAATIAIAKTAAKKKAEADEKEFEVVTDPETGDAVMVEKSTDERQNELFEETKKKVGTKNENVENAA